MLRENLKVVKLHNIIQMQQLSDKIAEEFAQKQIEEPMIEQYERDYEHCKMKQREVKQKRKEAIPDEDDEYHEMNKKAAETRKKNPPRKMRNSRRKKSLDMSNYMDESFEESDKWHE
uniref:Uncharacterized protein n=1 Tax=Euplotes harpa TaxID=151035 RepID=A0A7S3J3Y9_9SPIT|mmetsp:Transcript_18573/g.21341  ORF Transcript_18573/g.21341 Transcript_18573/m.21341 type:complete len:117 (+) Transcript_18573:544-894(+)